jgi:hypothetical protein
VYSKGYLKCFGHDFGEVVLQQLLNFEFQEKSLRSQAEQWSKMGWAGPHPRIHRSCRSCSSL